MKDVKWCLNYLAAHIRANKKKHFVMRHLIEKHIGAMEELNKMKERAPSANSTNPPCKYGFHDCLVLPEDCDSCEPTKLMLH